MHKSRPNKSGNENAPGLAGDSPPLWVMGVAIVITVGFLGLLMAA